MRRYFRKVIVIVPIICSARVLRADRLSRNYTYENVEVYFPRSLYVPLSWMNRVVIDYRLGAVERTIRRHGIEFDVIHAHFTWPSGYIGAILGNRYSRPVITTVHENGEWFEEEMKMDHRFINKAWRDCDALIRVNRKDVKALKEYNKSTISIPNGFPPSFYPLSTTQARRSLGLSQDCRILFSLGLLIRRKGYDYLIDAMKQVRDARDDVICYIGGAGPEQKRLRKKISRLGLEEHVHLLGPVPQGDLVLWMNACDAFVLPSLNEGNPTVMFEVLGCGKPFVGTRVGGVPEIITSEEYGLLVSPADAQDLSDKIIMAVSREWDRAAILRHSQQYSWENVVKEITGLYTRVMG